VIIRLAAGQFILKRFAMRFALHPSALRLATSDSNSAIDEQLPVDGLGPLFIGLVDWGWRFHVILRPRSLVLSFDSPASSLDRRYIGTLWTW